MNLVGVRIGMITVDYEVTCREWTQIFMWPPNGLCAALQVYKGFPLSLVVAGFFLPYFTVLLFSFTFTLT